MSIKTTVEITSDFSHLFDKIKSLPEMPCTRCEIIYKGKEDNFICSTCLEKEENQREEIKKKNHQIQTLLNLSNLPKRYNKAVFKPKTDIQNEVAEYFIENFTKRILETSTDVLLFGSIGTGKTYLSCAFAIDVIYTKQIRIKYITEYELLSLYFEKEYKLFKKFKESEILILDEIGKRVLTDWQRIQLEELLSYRYNEQLPTVYITNLEQKTFRDFLGSRLADRLKENKLKRFAFNGLSLRG